MITDAELIEKATSALNPRTLSPSCDVGSVASALMTESGKVYVGQCIDTISGMGFCAEHNAIGTMITDGESRVATIVAVDSDGCVLAPCGRCREFIFQVDNANVDTRVLLRGGRVVRLSALLPYNE